MSQRTRRLRRPLRPVYSGCDTCGEGASGRATLNGVARDRPGLVRQGVGALTSDLAARVEPNKQTSSTGVESSRTATHARRVPSVYVYHGIGT